MPYQWWRRGEVLASPLAFDTETDVRADDREVPTLALLVASDGVTARAVHPSDAGAFLDAHKRHRWYGYNVAFDFWVLDKALPGNRVLWDAANDGRLLCLRLLWRLVKLATIGIPERQGTLADACEEFDVSPVPDKADPYRMRYGELIGLPPTGIDSHPEAEGFLNYALNDAISTHGLIAPLTTRATSLMARYKAQMRPDALAKWGPLSAALQTRADVVLDRLSREPLRLDVEAVATMERETRVRVEELSLVLGESCPGLWQSYAAKGKYKGALRRSKTGLLQMSQAVLGERLTALADEAGVRTPYTPTGKVSLSAKEWGPLLPDAPFVKAWVEYEGLKKRLSTMLVPMGQGVIYANYETLLKTGRTSASKHRRLPGVPVQQVPRDNRYRKLFLADEGTERVTIDYSYLELRTLAACCLWRFGKSKLAEAVRSHTAATRAGKKGVPDPHEVMGAAIMGLSPEAFMALPPGERKAARQKAKPVNFGYPGGLGVRKFVEYAGSQYGLKVSLAESKALRETWMRTYPEMREWLADPTAVNLSENLHVPPSVIRSRFGDRLWNLRQAVEGWVDEETARPYIAKLREMCRNEEVATLLRDFDYSTASHEALTDAVLKGVSCTPTGRVRAKVGHSEGANNPFQGLASDGAKEALWRLLYAGYRVKAFIHDEILIDIPPGGRDARRRRVHEILDESMEDVMGRDVPCMSESHVGLTWVKG